MGEAAAGLAEFYGLVARRDLVCFERCGILGGLLLMALVAVICSVAIAALAPLIAIPSARWIEGYRPPPRYAIGALVAVWGLAGLALS